MRESAAQPVRPKLKAMVAEASQALACLDAVRLEELALCCQAFTGLPAAGSEEQRRLLESEAREAVGEMAVFARVLEATRANLKVMNRLREMRAEQVEYSQRQACGWPAAESGHGDD